MGSRVRVLGFGFWVRRAWNLRRQFLDLQNPASLSLPVVSVRQLLTVQNSRFLQCILAVRRKWVHGVCLENAWNSYNMHTWSKHGCFDVTSSSSGVGF